MLVQELVERHAATLARASEAIATREFWSAYPEALKAQPEEAVTAGQQAFDSYLGGRFPLDQPGATGTVRTELSPYGLELEIDYPHADAEILLAAAQAAIAPWRALTPRERAAVCVEVIARLHARSVEIAHAVMHTTGQAFGMAFQAGGPHAQDRALEAVAYALRRDDPARRAQARWEKPAGQARPAA